MYGVSYTEEEVSNVDMSLQRNFYIKFPYICRHTFSLELCSDERIIFRLFKMDFSYVLYSVIDVFFGNNFFLLFVTKFLMYLTNSYDFIVSKNIFFTILHRFVGNC